MPVFECFIIISLKLSVQTKKEVTQMIDDTLDEKKENSDATIAN